MSGYTGYALRFISGKYQGNEFPLKANHEVIVGRGSELEIVLMEDMVSRHHAKFVTGDDYVIIQDLGSTNGTFVNGERIRKIRLRDGDRILIGTSILKLIPYEGNFEDEFVPENRMLPPASAGPPKRKPIGLLGPGSSAPSAPNPPDRSTMRLPAFQDPSGPPGGPPIPTSSRDNMMGPPIPSPSRDNMMAPPEPFASSPSFSSMPAAAPPSSSGHEPAPDFGSPVMNGTLDETPLQELLELFANSRKNGVLVVKGEREGRMHIRDGRLVYSTLDNNPSVDPRKAALRILTWSRGEFALYPPHDQSIHQEFTSDLLKLLREAQRLNTELKRHKAELPAGLVNYNLTRPMQAPLRDLRPNQLELIQLIHNHGNLHAVLDNSPFGDVETYQNLAYLFRLNYISAR